MCMTSVRNSYACQVLPFGLQFKKRLMKKIDRRRGRLHEINLNYSEANDLELERNFCAKVRKYTSFKFTARRKLLKAHVSESHLCSLGGFSVKYRQAWKLKLPDYLVVKALHNLLHFVEEITCIQIDAIGEQTNAHYYCLHFGNNTSKISW